MIIRNRKQTMIIPCITIALSLAGASALGDESALLRGKHLNRRLTSREVQFVNDCSTELLIDSVLGDQMISQIEFTATYSRLCTKFDVSDCIQDATFETLDEDIQFAFASDICHDESTTCLKNLINLSKANNEVGYVVSSQTAVVQNLVNNICVELEYAVLGKIGISYLDSAAYEKAQYLTPISKPQVILPMVWISLESILVLLQWQLPLVPALRTSLALQLPVQHVSCFSTFLPESARIANNTTDRLKISRVTTLTGRKARLILIPLWTI
jgi:hypothetical protein